jgi:hypothetical protein
MIFDDHQRLITTLLYRQLDTFKIILYKNQMINEIIAKAYLLILKV